LSVTNEGAHIGTGGNIAVNIGGNLTATGLGSATEFPEPGDFEAVVQNTNGQIDNGGNLNLTVNGNVQVNGLAAYVENYDETANPAGHIGTGGNIDIEIGGNLTANSYVDAFLNNRGGGMIDSGGNLMFNVSGALTIGADAGGGAPGFSAEFIVSTRYDDIMGNTTPSFIGSDVSLFVHAASVDMAGSLFGSGISNRGGSVIDGNATATWDVPGAVNIQGTGGNNVSGIAGASWWVLNDIPPDAVVMPAGGGTIHGNATVTLNIGGDLIVAGDGEIFIANQRNFQSTAPSGGTIDSDATLNITAANFSVGGELDVEIDNFISGSSSGTGGSIGGNAAINLNLSGNLTTPASDPNSLGIPGNAYFQIRNESLVGGSPGGFIGGDAILDITIGGDFSAAGDLFARIYNDGGGFIGGDAMINFSANAISTGGSDPFPFAIQNLNGGHIVGDADLQVTTAGGITGNSFATTIDNSTGGMIDSNALINLNAGGNINLQGTAIFAIFNSDNGNASGGGAIGGNAVVNVSAGNINAGSLEHRIFNSGGSIGESASLAFNLSGNLTTQDFTVFQIFNSNDGSGSGGGMIGSSAAINVSATNISGGTLNGGIDNTGGSIGESANLNFNLTGDLTTVGDAFFEIDNPNGGTIGSGATISLSATNISTGDFLNVIIFNGNGGAIGSDALITINATNLSVGGSANFFTMDNSGGSIGGGATINFNLGGDLTSPGQPFFGIFNSNAGTITSDATINVSAANITANSLVAQIDNTEGSIGGNAAINMNVSSTANVTTDATVAIYGSDGAASAAINFNGGSYNVGGTFLSYIDGNGMITFNNAFAHANILKAGVFGANGVLNIGGGMLSADTELKLYAPGSNGQLNFLSNVTLGGNSVKILAADSVTIFNNVVVTIGGPNAADVYTNNANYTGFGGNGTTTGTFAGAGANNPQPLSNAPPFGPSSPASMPHRRQTGGGGTINVNSTAELLAMLDGAAFGPDGRVRFSDRKRTGDWRNFSRMYANALLRSERRAMDPDVRHMASLARGRLPQ
jgi:hypothetical protein